MKKILNLTQHAATPEQVAAGVFEPAEDEKQAIRDLLTFDGLPENYWRIRRRAFSLAALASEICEREKARHVMIGGAPYLMPALQAALFRVGLIPVYAFSKREAVEEQLPDGSVKKSMIFRHLGFVVPEYE